MQEFKAGDLVEVTEADYFENWYSVGEVYKVRRQEGDNVFVNGVKGFQYDCFNGDNDDSIWISAGHLTLKSRKACHGILIAIDEFGGCDPEVIAHMIQQSLAQSALQEALEETEEGFEGGFEVGDVVVISEAGREKCAVSGNNPDCHGVITGDDRNMFGDFKYRVNWDNGGWNAYKEGDLEHYIEETPEVKMIVDLQQIKEASEYCAVFNPYVHEDAEYFEQEIFSAIERYVDGKTYTAIYGFYVLFEKEFDDVVFVSVLVDPRLGMSGEYTEATLKDGILVKGF